MDWNRLANAAASFIRSLLIGVAGVILLGGRESIPDDWRGWIFLICLALNSSYDKYSTSTRMLAPDRKILTEEERRRLITGSKPSPE